MGGRRVSRLCIALCIALACEATTSFAPTAVARLRGGSSTAAWQDQAVEEIERLDRELGEQEEEIQQDRERAAEAREWEARAGQRMVRRAAFDVGSGAVKMSIADLDTHAGVLPSIEKEVHSMRENLLLSEELERSGGQAFPQRALDDLEAILRRMASEAKARGAEQLAGVATAAFRKASNGAEFLHKVRDDVGINIFIISQEQEAAMGFLTACATSSSQLMAQEIVSWDSGGGSFQLAGQWEGTLQTWLRPVGSGVATSDMVQKVQGKDFSVTRSPNPVKLSEAQSLATHLKTAIGNPPDWVSTKLKVAHVKLVGIGGDMSIFRLACELAGGKKEVKRLDVLDAIENMCGKTDLNLRSMEDVPAAHNMPHNVVPKLVLLYAVMDLIGAESVMFKETNGNLPGILVTPQFWEDGEVSAECKANDQ